MPRILHLEDDPIDAELIQQTLLADGIDADIVVVTRESEYEAALGKHPFDLVLADHGLPSFDSLTALALARQKQPGLPFVSLSGFQDPQRGAALLAAGAAACIPKGRPEQIVAAVRQALLAPRSEKA